MQEIIIDEGFKMLLPPLHEKESGALEEDILVHGCMNPLVLWNNNFGVTIGGWLLISPKSE